MDNLSPTSSPATTPPRKSKDKATPKSPSKLKSMWADIPLEALGEVDMEIANAAILCTKDNFTHFSIRMVKQEKAAFVKNWFAVEQSLMIEALKWNTTQSSYHIQFFTEFETHQWYKQLSKLGDVFKALGWTLVFPKFSDDLTSPDDERLYTIVVETKGNPPVTKQDIMDAISDTVYNIHINTDIQKVFFSVETRGLMCNLPPE